MTKIERVKIHFSVDKGYYCTVDGDIKITEQFLADVAKRMRWLSDEKIPIKKKTIHTDDAIDLFPIDMECMIRKNYLNTGGFQK